MTQKIQNSWWATEENRVEVENIQMDLSSLQKDNLYQIILATNIEPFSENREES